MLKGSRRNRTISLRLSEEEYEAILRRCRAGGGGHLSDLIRTAVSRAIEDTQNRENLDAQLHDIGSRLEFMDRELKRLSRLLGERSDT